MSTVSTQPDTYGLSSGLPGDERPAARRVPCPWGCGDLHGGPVRFWCRVGHGFTAATLMEWQEERVHRACEARAAELELERATHVPEWRPGR